MTTAAVQEEPERLYDPNLTDSERQRQVTDRGTLSYIDVAGNPIRTAALA